MIEKYELFKRILKQYVIGYDEIIDALFVCLLAEGHVLLEGPPGVAKTTLAKTFAKLLNMQFKRIQFTPDLLPSDIIGTVIFNPSTGTFEVRFGPIFTNLLLADEINRAPPKTQSALLEAMEEKQVTIEGVTYRLEEPFMVIATQNPVEQEGTYPLPEAQLDRFLMKINVHYPNLDDERRILFLKESKNLPQLYPIFTIGEILQMRSYVERVYVSPEIIDYISRIVCYIRNHPAVEWGPGPRASIALLKVSKAVAFLNGRDYVTPRDVRRFAIWVLHHRFGVKPEYESEGIKNEDIVKEALSHIDAP